MLGADFGVTRGDATQGHDLRPLATDPLCFSVRRAFTVTTCRCPAENSAAIPLGSADDSQVAGPTGNFLERSSWEAPLAGLFKQNWGGAHSLITVGSANFRSHTGAEFPRALSFFLSAFPLSSYYFVRPARSLGNKSRHPPHTRLSRGRPQRQLFDRIRGDSRHCGCNRSCWGRPQNVPVVHNSLRTSLGLNLTSLPRALSSDLRRLLKRIYCCHLFSKVTMPSSPYHSLLFC